MTQEELDKLYLKIIAEQSGRSSSQIRNVEEYLVEIRDEIRNGNLSALGTAEQIVNNCIKKIRNENDFDSCRTLLNCVFLYSEYLSSDVCNDIKVFIISFIENYKNEKKNDRQYGAACLIAYWISRGYDHFLDMMKVATKKGIFCDIFGVSMTGLDANNDDDLYVTKCIEFILESEESDEKNKVLEICVNLCTSGIYYDTSIRMRNPYDLLKNKNCVDWLNLIAEGYEPLRKNVVESFISKSDIVGKTKSVLKTIFKYSDAPASKWKAFVWYYEKINKDSDNDEEKRELNYIIDDNLAEIINYSNVDLTDFLSLYFIDKFDSPNSMDFKLLNKIKSATAEDAENPLVYLKNNISFCRNNTNFDCFGFLNILSNYDDYDKYPDLNNYFESLFREFDKFSTVFNGKIFQKVIKMNNCVINNLIEIVKGFNSFFNDGTELNDLQLNNLAVIIKSRIPQVSKKIGETLLCSVTEIENKLVYIRLNFSYEEKRWRYNVTDLDYQAIREQIKIVRKLMSQKCFGHSYNACTLFNNLFGILEEEYHEGINIERLLSIMPSFSGDNPTVCKDKELWREILKLKHLLMDVPFDFPILGEYCNKEITLYLANIREYKGDILTTYAHELFHAYHAACVENNGKAWNVVPESKSSIVVESLASYFENVFSHDGYEHSKLAETWRRYTIKSWPYAGAKHLLPYGGGYSGSHYPSNVLFRYVFNESLNSLEDAYKMIEFGEKMEFEDF